MGGRDAERLRVVTVRSYLAFLLGFILGAAQVVGLQLAARGMVRSTWERPACADASVQRGVQREVTFYRTALERRILTTSQVIVER